ncbi:MAG: hypothetical protein KF775_12400 [Cyclobacteriaceae bacterium]|nr:hypothetical protein [Cyclobacteriaceae bacterium]
MDKGLLTILIRFLYVMTLTSCDPGIAVVIQNKSKSDKHIKVFYPKEFKFPGDHEYAAGIRDSIQTYDLSLRDNYLNPKVIPKLDWDTVTRTYSFILKKDYSAKIESRFLATNPTWGQTFVINNVDTVKLDSKDKSFKKKPKVTLGGTWTYTIADR